MLASDSDVVAVPLSLAQARLVMLSLAIGSFAIGTGEFVIMGLLPDAARDLGVSVVEAGYLISIYALGVVVGAPVLAVFGARLPRRTFLVGLMSLFAVANLMSALAPGFVPMIFVRFLAGFPHGAFFGVASLVAASLVDREYRTRAVASVFLGVTTATLLGVPLSAAIGQLIGWRSAFVIVGVIGAMSALMILRLVPFVPGDRGASPMRELRVLRNRQVLLTLAVGAIGSGGLFAIFSYIKPTMMQMAGLPESLVPVVLALFGVGMVSGNLIVPRFADRSLDRTIFALLIWGVIVASAFYFTANSSILGSINVLLVGTVVGLAASLQTRLMDAAGDAQTLAAALNHSAFNVANALGAWLGGVAIDTGLGWSSTGLIGAVLACGGLALHLWAVVDNRSYRLARE